MPLWLIKLLPYGAAALAIGGAVLFIDHRGFQRAEDEAVARDKERQLQAAQFELIVQGYVHDSENKMILAIASRDGDLVKTLQSIRDTNRTVIQPTLVKEIQSEARFSDPASGITDGMLRELNRARLLSQPACAAGIDTDDCRALSSTVLAD